MLRSKTTDTLYSKSWPVSAQKESGNKVDSMIYMPEWDDYLRVFKIARLSLGDETYRYMKGRIS